MKYLNKHDLPRSIFEALTKETYDGPTTSQTTISTTGLSVPPRIRQLLIRYRDVIEQDASDLLWILMGNAVHEVLGRVNKKNRIVEERLEVELGDFKISGKPDLYDKVLQTVEDYKITSVWATKEVKREWEEQINVNAWILRKHNYPIKGGFINAILRDWNRREAKRNPEYPQISFKRIPIKIWTLKQQEQFIKDRLELHHTQSKLPDNELLLCTPEERWAKPEQFAVYKNKNKRATKLFDTEEDAKTFAAQLEEGSKDKIKVENRPGQDIRCMDYCLVNNFCSYYKEKYGGKDE